MRDIEVTDREGIQALHDNLITKWRNGWSVANPDSGSCKVIIDTGNLGAGESAIAVQTGTALANGDKISKDSRETVDIEPVTSSPRQDTIALNPDGSVAYYKGVEEPLRPSGREIEDAERPAPPDLQGEDVVPLAVVTVPRETETITNGNLIDIRVRADMTFDELRVHSTPELDTDVFRFGDMSTIRAIDHGADPTGTDGSSAALQSAVDEANPGDRVVFGEQGTYYLEDQIEINKRIVLDLHEGEIESDYHDMQSYDVGQEYHYYPLFKVAGTQGTDYDITAYVDKGEDQVEVSDPSVFSVGQGVMLRNTQPNKTTDPGFGYQPTITRIRDIENGVIYLEDPALREYSPNSGHTLCSVDLLTSPVLKNIHVTSRVEPYFDSDLGKVVGGPRHLIATELTDHVKIENCSVHNYDSHVWTSYDDRAPTVEDVEARVAMNLSGSCGEAFWLNGTNDVSLVRPKVTEARRGVDVRSGIGEVTVTEPQIASISHIGISWHDSTDVEADITVIGGRVDCKPDDPTMQKDSSLDQRYETQSGIPFNSGSGARLRTIGTDFVSRQAAYLNGEAEIKGGSIYKYRTAGTVLSIDASDVSVEDCEFGCYGSLSNLVEVTGGENIDLRGIHLNSTAAPSETVHVTGGENITVDGYVTGSAGDREILIEGGDGVSCDVDMNSSANYAYLVTAGSNISIEGDVDGSISNEVIRLDGGTDISIDANLTASGSDSVRGVRILGGTDIEITGRYSGPAIGIMFSGAATSVNVHDMRINVTTSQDYAFGSNGTGVTITNLKIVNNDMRGSTDNILMNDDVDGLWAVNNLCSDVGYTSGTIVGQVYGNGSDAPEVITTEHSTNTSNPHNVTANQANALPITGGDVQGELRVDGDGTASEEGLRLSIANDIYPEVDSSQSSGDDPNFNVTISDIQGARPEIHWRRMVNSSSTSDEAFGVYDITNDTELFTVEESGRVDVNGRFEAGAEANIAQNANIGGDLDVAGSGIIDDLTIRQDPGFVLQPAADVESHLESGASSADRTGFNFQMLDDDGVENRISWQVNAAARRAFSVWDIDADSHFFTVDYDGEVSIPNGGLGVNGDIDMNDSTVKNLRAETDGLQWSLDTADGSRDWAKLQFDDANGDNVYWTTNRASADAFRVTNSSTGTDLINVNDGGLLEVPNGNVEIQGSTSATQPWVTNNTPAGDQALETGDLVHVATTSGGDGDGTYSTTSGSYVDVDNNTTGDLAAMQWDSLPSYSWDDGSVYVSVHVTVSIDGGSLTMCALDTQNDVRLTTGEVTSSTTGFHGIGTTPVAHSPTDTNTRWSFAIKGDGSNTVTYGKNRTINFYRQVA